MSIEFPRYKQHVDVKTLGQSLKHYQWRLPCQPLLSSWWFQPEHGVVAAFVPLASGCHVAGEGHQMLEPKLASVVTDSFNTSLQLFVVPSSFKTLVIVPVL